MKVTVATLTDFIFVLDVSEDLELENFKAFCEIESGCPASEILIAFNGMPLMDNKKSLKDHGIKDGDAVILQRMSGSQTSFGHNSGKNCFCVICFNICLAIFPQQGLVLIPNILIFTFLMRFSYDFS